MKKLVLPLLFTIILFNSGFGQNTNRNPLTNNYLSNTYMIDSDTLQGTCLRIKYNDKIFLITARHLFKKNVQSSDRQLIHLLIDNRLISFKVKVFFSPDSNIDIALIEIDGLYHDLFNIPKVNLDFSINLGTSVYFLGYPTIEGKPLYSYAKQYGKEWQIPFVKGGILSAVIKLNHNNALFLIDGYNNSGFSGGPVIFYNEEGKETAILGVVNGYYHNIIELNGNTKLYENTGITICSGINAIKEIYNMNF